MKKYIFRQALYLNFFIFLFSFIIPTIAPAEIVFQEDFESYELGTDLSGQGGWEGGGWDGTWPILIGFGTGLPSTTKVLHGRIDPGHSNDAYSRKPFYIPSEDTDLITLKFDAYAYSTTPGYPNAGGSHGSGVGFHRGNFNWGAMWMAHSNPVAGDNPVPNFQGWMFDARFLTGDSTALYWISGGYDEQVTMSIIIDPINLELYGIADFGNQEVYETDHFNILADRLSGLNGVMVSQDYRLPYSSGAEFDNIILEFLIQDTDGDGIPDDQDACPYENATGFDTDEDGCIDNLTGLNEMLESLVDQGIIAAELKNSLLSKVANAEKSADKENIAAAINKLEALINEINAQVGKKIAEEAAVEIINYIESIINWLTNQLV